MRPIRLLLLSLLHACNPTVCGPGTQEKDGTCLPLDEEADPETEADGEADTDTDTDADTDADTDTDTDTDADTDSVTGRGLRFAPFVDATLYPVARVGDIAEITGVLDYSLGFVVSEAGSCAASWGGYYGVEAGPDSWGEGGQYFLYDEVRRLRDLGGDVIVSFGGASGSPLAAGCTDMEALIAEYDRVITALDLHRLDFDVEGVWLADRASVQRRNQALAALQTRRASAGWDLELWFTLPVLPSGLTPDGLALVEDALAQGVEIAGVNVMTMDYGDVAAPDPEGQMGRYAIDAVTALHGQLDTLYREAGQPLDSAALWARIGATPMIGLNDVLTETFTLEDARELSDFARANGMAMLSMWSVNRDHPCPDSSVVQLTCSSSPDQDADWQFMAVLGGG